MIFLLNESLDWKTAVKWEEKEKRDSGMQWSEIQRFERAYIGVFLYLDSFFPPLRTFSILLQ